MACNAPSCMQWDAIYKSEVSPVLANFSSGPPIWVYVMVGLFALAGIALIIWAPLKVKLGGVVLLFFCGFIGFMVLKSSGVKPGQPAEFHTGTVLEKIRKKQVVKKTTGIMEPEITYWIRFQTNESGKFDDSGILESLEPEDVEREILISESLYASLREGQSITGVILPTAQDSFHFLVQPDGSVLK